MAVCHALKNLGTCSSVEAAEALVKLQGQEARRDATPQILGHQETSASWNPQAVPFSNPLKSLVSDPTIHHKCFVILNAHFGCSDGHGFAGAHVFMIADARAFPVPALLSLCSNYKALNGSLLSWG